MLLTKSGSSTRSETTLELNSDWQLACVAPGAISHPTDLQNIPLEWIPAIVPGTVAQSLQVAGRWDLTAAFDFDASDWWYQTHFGFAPNQSLPAILQFEGLATLAQVWLNGENILTSDNMFVEHRMDVSRLLQANNTLTLCFRSMNALLSERRPRPRWKTRLVQQQQLRWIRTTLLGRIPGWSPPIAPVGPWRSMSLITVEPAIVSDLSVRTLLKGLSGEVDISCLVQTDKAIDTIEASLNVAGKSGPLAVIRQDDGFRIQGQLTIDQPSMWWPHTHGEPALHHCELHIRFADQMLNVHCGDVGFRTITVDQQQGAFDVYINGVKIFCRGACWTVNDIVALYGSAQDMVQMLTLARDAGVNMLRIGGTMIYESEWFYSVCDRLGILVWQDFMFANMDYPIDDETFRASVTLEVSQQLQRWQSHPCITVYCGNSEVEQQAAMLGMPAELWRSQLFGELIPRLCEHYHPGIPYIASTPSGGVLPFHVGAGVTHYYGVGAYLRPVTEVRRAQVRFTPECLGFSNVPEPQTVNNLFDGQLAATHTPIWKSRVPRDSGTGWDFEDVRDHYLKILFGLDPVQLRWVDTERYLALGRITSGEMMSQVYAEWRSPYSQCGGALVWFYKDLWPGAGWGIVDSTGIPKACYYYLKRAWQPRQIVITDELLDGLHLHVINETTEALKGNLEIRLLKYDNVTVAKASRDCDIAPRSSLTFYSDDLLGGFYDVSYVYRFGPPKHDVVAATLKDESGNTISESYYFPGQHRVIPSQTATHLIAEAVQDETGDYRVHVQSDIFLYSVHFEVDGFIPSDNYFHLLPGVRKEILLRKVSHEEKKFKAYVTALNLQESVKVTIK